MKTTNTCAICKSHIKKQKYENIRLNKRNLGQKKKTTVNFVKNFEGENTIKEKKQQYFTIIKHLNKILQLIMMSVFDIKKSYYENFEWENCCKST